MRDKLYTCARCAAPSARNVLYRYAGVCQRCHKRAAKLPPPPKSHGN